MIVLLAVALAAYTLDKFALAVQEAPAVTSRLTALERAVERIRALVTLLRDRQESDSRRVEELERRAPVAEPTKPAASSELFSASPSIAEHEPVAFIGSRLAGRGACGPGGCESARVAVPRQEPQQARPLQGFGRRLLSRLRRR